MACVTLKRPLDFDPLESLHSPNRPATKRRRCTPIKKMDSRSDATFRNPAVGKIPPMMPMGPTAMSVFNESQLTTEEVAKHLRDELKRMKRRRQLVPYIEEPIPSSSQSPQSSSSSAARTIHSAPGSPEPMEGSRSALPSSSSAQVAPVSAKTLMGTKEKPVFTLKQMTMICERMCQERTDKVRQEYDQILQQKLSEQYDAFVKFIDHQIQQRFKQSQLPSYLS